MITYVVCDLFTSPARTLVNTVNTVGVMGKGIARDFKTIYPEMFARYQELCEKGLFATGQLWLYRTPHKWVLNFPTKKHWRSPSRPDYIEAGLRKFADTYHVYGITDISFPLLGCGNGELNWETQVRPLMEQYLGKLPIDVYIHWQDLEDPYMPEHRSIRETREWLRGEPESLAFTEVWADLVSVIGAGAAGDGSDDPFPVRIGADEVSIILELANGSVAIPEAAFLDLWQQLRAAGFLGGDYLPGGLSEYADWIILLMAKLPYIQPVKMARRSRGVSPQTLGLRIIPGKGGPTRQLEQLSLSGASAVELL